MNPKNLLLTAFVAASALLSSCSQDPYIITSEEEFTRNFIKTFGLIDPNQDWNMAESATVTVNAGSSPTHVKVYCKAGDKYYLVADLENVSGKVKIPLDVPKGSKDLYVKVNGKGYYASVDAPARVKSRGVEVGATTLTDALDNEYTVTVTKTNPMYFNAQQVAPVTADYVWNDYVSIRSTYDDDNHVELSYTDRVNPSTNYNRGYGADDLYYDEYNNDDMVGWGILPELDHDVSDKNNGVGNIGITLDGAPKIAADFTVETGDASLTIYPIYKNTSRDHTLGIYLLDDDGNPIKDDKDKILRFPIYNDEITNESGNGIEYYKKVTQTSKYITYWNSLPPAFQTYLTQKTSLSPSVGANSSISAADWDSYLAAFKTWFNDGGTVDDGFMVLPSNPEGSSYSEWMEIAFPSSDDYEIADIYIHSDNFTWGELKWTIDFAPKTAGADAPYNLLLDGNGTWEPASPNEFNLGGNQANAIYPTDEPLLLRTDGIQIDLGTFTGSVGMYIESGGTIYYSQAGLNGNKSYAASYVHPMSDRVYFSFEDWPGGGDEDFNDLIFILSNFSKVGSDDLDIEGDTPDPDSTPDPVLVETGFHWIVVAEDLGVTDDFDFNDVVFSISSITTNKYNASDVTGTEGNYTPNAGATAIETTKSVRIKPLAAGGTLETYLCYNDGTNDYVIGRSGVKPLAQKSVADEWHCMFGNGNRPYTSMINTTGESNLASVSITLSEAESPIDLSGFTVTNYSVKQPSSGKIVGFYLIVNGYNYIGNIGGTVTNRDDDENTTTIAGGGQGQAPQMFLISDPDNNWKWPTERTRIFEAYTGFNAWVNDATNSGWHLTPAYSSLVIRPSNVDR